MATAPKQKAEAEDKKPVLQTGDEPDLFGAADNQVELDAAGGGNVADPPDGGENDPSIELKRQLDDLKRNEELQRQQIEHWRQQAENAQREAKEREAEAGRFRAEAGDHQMVAFDNAISAVRAEADSAQRDIENAVAIGDASAQAEAYRRLARAETKAQQLESGKEALASRVEQMRAEQEEIARNVNDPLEKTALPPLAKQWLRSHPEYLSDRRKNAKIQSLHFDVLEEGYSEFSPKYFDRLEELLGMRKMERRDDDDVERDAIVSAPPSREAPSGDGSRPSGRIHLTAAQRDAARMAGITDAEYAKQLTALRNAKANGMYGERG